MRKLALERKKEIESECTIKPKTNTSQFECKLEMNRGERLARLYKPKTAEMQKREKLKRQKDEQQFANICSFQPKRIARSISVATRKNCEDVIDQPIDDRLVSDANKRIENMRNGYKRKAERELKGCTFHPDISVSSKNVNRDTICSKPIYERAKEIQKEKEEYLQKLRMEAELNDRNLSFKPKIIKKSEEIMMNKSDIIGKSVTERLWKDASERVEKDLKQVELLNQERFVQYPFNPRLYVSTYRFNCIG